MKNKFIPRLEILGDTGPLFVKCALYEAGKNCKIRHRKCLIRFCGIANRDPRFVDKDFNIIKPKIINKDKVWAVQNLQSESELKRYAAFCIVKDLFV